MGIIDFSRRLHKSRMDFPLLKVVVCLSVEEMGL